VPFLSPVYLDQENAFGFRNIPPFSPVRGWNAFQANPGLFTETPAQIVAAENFRVTNSEYLRERVSALYAQTEIRLLKSRLHILAGVRYEKTTDRGEGALRDPSAAFIRNSDGSFARDNSGNRVRKPEAGTPGSMEELHVILRERRFHTNRSYDGYYPSVHVNYNFSENIIGRLAYAKTYGRPDFTEIIPNVDIDDEARILSARNPALEPWDADNYDLSLEYYTKNGGVISAGLFRKKVNNFFSSTTKIATEADITALELDPSYVGWDVESTFNVAGSARIDGIEANINQSLERLGGWARHFSVFANGTKLWIKGTQSATFTDSVPESFNCGFSFSRKPFAFAAKYNYRGRQRGSAVAALGPEAYLYEEARDTLDLNAEYQWSQRLSVFANAQNVFDEPIITLRRGPDTPAYAQRQLTSVTGVTLALGIKGTF
jgi:TonB-dependent receptor